MSGATVYAGGRFTSIGGQTRNHLAALDAASGAATAWNPHPSDCVYSLAWSEGTLYVGVSSAPSVGSRTATSPPSGRVTT